MEISAVARVFHHLVAAVSQHFGDKDGLNDLDAVNRKLAIQENRRLVGEVEALAKKEYRPTSARQIPGCQITSERRLDWLVSYGQRNGSAAATLKNLGFHLTIVAGFPVIATPFLAWIPEMTYWATI